MVTSRITSACIILAALTQGTAKSELILHYEFENNLTDSVGIRNGTMIGGVESYASGRFGDSVKLPGTTDSRISVAAWQPELSSFTVAGWVNAADSSEFYQTVPVSYAMPVVSFHTGGFSGGFRMGVFNTDNLGTYRPGIQLRGSDSSFDEIITSTSYDFGEWIHLAATVDRDTDLIKFYYNGAHTGTTNLTVTTLTPTKGFLGSYDADSARNGHDRYWSPTARLDDIRIYNEALSVSEIASLAAVPEPGTFAALGLGLAGFGAVQYRRRKKATACSNFNTSRSLPDGRSFISVSPKCAPNT